jgi:hypothetical protein
MRRILAASCIVMLVSTLVPPAAPAQQAATPQVAAPQVTPPQVKTSKERLSRKADDEQRIDNCRVPADLRGATPRPGCPDEQAASTTR